MGCYKAQFSKCQEGYAPDTNGNCIKQTCSEQDSNLVSANDAKVSNTTDYKCTDDTEGRTDAYGTCKKCIGKKTCYIKVGTPSYNCISLPTASGGTLTTCRYECSKGELVTIVLAGSTLKPTETEKICGQERYYFDASDKEPNCYPKDMSISIEKPVDPSVPDIPAVGIK